MSENSTGVTVTLKGGQGFEAPWIVIHAESAADALQQINDANFAQLAERSAAAAEFFRAANAGRQGFPKAVAEVQQDPGPSWSQQGSQQAAPAAPAPAPAGKSCVHGQMVYREGTSAKGAWKGYFCPLPQSQKAQQCTPEFLPR